MSKDKGKGKPGKGDKHDDVLEGTPRSDLLLGKKGSDILIGKGGDDLLIGGKGLDTALYSGSFLDYRILTLGPVAIVHDLRGRSPDGTDMLLQIEQAQFADYTLFLDGRNNAPYAVADSAETSEDDALVVSRAQILANDRDPDGNKLSIVEVQLVSGAGSVALAKGNVVYDPGAAYQHLDAGETATVVLEYKVTDGRGAFDTAHITITVKGADDAPANQAPVAADDAFSMQEDGVLSGGVLGNDSDADLDALSAVLDAGPEHGTVVLNADGSFTYTPDANFNGEDSFTYRASDGAASSDPATVSIQVAAVNDAPLANADSHAASDDGIAAIGNVLDNDSDIDGPNELAVTAGEFSLAHGTLELGAQGDYRYRVTDETLGLGDLRTDAFTYTVSDGPASTTAVIEFHVAGANDGPVADDDVLADPFGSTGPETRADAVLLEGDTDVDQNTVLQVQGGQVTSLLGATVSFDGGEFTYDASAVAELDLLPAHLTAFDRFTYTVSDGDGGSDTATVDLAVRGRLVVENAPPVAAADTLVTGDMFGEDGSIVPLSIPVALLTGNDSDPDGDALSIIDVANASGGTVSLSGGVITFVVEPSAGTGTAPSTIVEAEPNEDIDTAQPIARAQFGVAPSGEVDDDSLPRVSIQGDFPEGDSSDVFAFDLRAGERITLDMDATGGLPTVIALLDAEQDFLAFSFGEDPDGDGVFTEPQVDYDITADGTYYALVQGAGAPYVLNVSLDPVERVETSTFEYILSDGRGGEAVGSVTIEPVYDLA